MNDVLKAISCAYAERERYWPHYTWHIQTHKKQLLNKAGPSLVNLGVAELLEEKWFDIFDKINAGFYHLERIKECEAYMKNVGEQVAKSQQQSLQAGILGIFGPTYEPIGYEYESLLIKIRSALDILTVVMAKSVDLKMKRANFLVFTDRFSNMQVRGFAKRIQNLIKSDLYTKLDQEFRNKKGTPSKRNYAAHLGSLPLATMNVQFSSGNSKLNIFETATISGFKMKSSSRCEPVSSFAQTLFFNAADFIINVLEILLGEKLIKGEKKSVLQVKIEQSSH